MLATNEGDLTMIELLLEHGTEINAEDEDGNTALHIAVLTQSVNSSLGQVGEVAFYIFLEKIATIMWFISLPFTESAVAVQSNNKGRCDHRPLARFEYLCDLVFHLS